MAKKSTKQNIIDVINGISSVVSSKGFDGALDDEGKPIKIGMKREVDNPILDSRVSLTDGFNVQFAANKMILNYQSEIMIEDVHNKKFEKDIEQRFADIISFIKKEYKKMTGTAVLISPDDKEVKLLVQNTSRVRAWVQGHKRYVIDSIDTEELKSGDKEKEKIDKNIRKFLDLAQKAKRPENEKIKPSDNEKEK